MERTNFTMAMYFEPHVSLKGSMETEEGPHREVPVPSPHPSSVLGSSSLLDLTPEKPPPPPSAARGGRRRRRSGNRPVALKQHDFLQNGRSPAGDEAGVSETAEVRVCTAELGVPGLHSTAPLYHKLQQYCSVNGRTRGGGGGGGGSERGLVRKKGEILCRDGEREADREEEDPLQPPPPPPLRSSSPAIASSAHLKVGEGGVGSHRYTDLVAVDVSEESFQRLTTRSRKKAQHLPRSGGRGTNNTAPNIMDFFSPDFEAEDIAVPTLPAPPNPLPIEPSIDDALNLYHFVYR